MFPYAAMISCEAVKAPVLGVYLSFVELTFCVVTEPDVALVNTKYLTAAVVVSSAIVMPPAGLVQVAGEPAPAEVKT